MAERLHLDHGVVNSFLRGLRYPLTKSDLLRLAKENQVVGEYLTAFERLPEGLFTSQAEIMELLQQHNLSIE